jgi:hypothetical protein
MRVSPSENRPWPSLRGALHERADQRIERGQCEHGVVADPHDPVAPGLLDRRSCCGHRATLWVSSAACLDSAPVPAVVRHSEQILDIAIQYPIGAAAYRKDLIGTETEESQNRDEIVHSPEGAYRACRSHHLGALDLSTGLYRPGRF